LALNTARARSCFQACLPAYSHSEARYWQCLSACPDLKVDPGATCTASDVPPRAVCGTGTRTFTRREVEGRAGLIGGMIGFVGGAALGATVVVAGATSEDGRR